MPTKKYRVETDKGAYIVEVGDDTPAGPIPHAMGEITEDPSQDRTPTNGWLGKLAQSIEDATYNSLNGTNKDDGHEGKYDKALSLVNFLIPSAMGVGAPIGKSLGKLSLRSIGDKLTTGGNAIEDLNVLKPAQIPGKVMKWAGGKLNPESPATGAVMDTFKDIPAPVGRQVPSIPPKQRVSVPQGPDIPAPLRNGPDAPTRGLNTPPLRGPGPVQQGPDIPAPERGRLNTPPLRGTEPVPAGPDIAAPVRGRMNEPPLRGQVPPTQGPDIPIPDRGRFNEPPQRVTGIDSSNTTTPPALRKWNEKPSLDEVLQQALQEAAAPEKPSLVSGAPEPTTAAGGPHTGKVRKGQGKGFDSGNPSTRPMDSPLDPTNPNAGEPAPWESDWATKMPGETTPPPAPKPDTSGGAFGSTENPEWHSGAEPGSKAARQAQSSHQYEQEMDAGYRRHTATDAEMLRELLRQLGQE